MDKEKKLKSVENNSDDYIRFAKVVAGCLFQSDSLPEITEEILVEAKKQSINLLLKVDAQSLSVLKSNINLLFVQDELDCALKSIPYVILKGMAAAVYYSDPLRRTMGDIDVLVEPSSFEAAYKTLIENGFETNEDLSIDERHVHFKKSGIIVELHKRFAVLDSVEQEESLDRLLFNSIVDAKDVLIQKHHFKMLPDLINGLVLIAHVNQHIEFGLGFRQVIDWIMYVNKALHDDNWIDFKSYLDAFGLTRLAKTTTRLGQIYLGLDDKDITWCKDVDAEVCDQYLKYLFETGNFGSKKKGNVSNSVQEVLRSGRNPKRFFSVLQESGKSHWALCSKHKSLCSVAWAYGAYRYVKMGIKRKHVIRESIKDIWMTKKKDEFLLSIGGTIRTKKTGRI